MIFEQVAKFALRNGFKYPDLAEELKSAFVCQARSEVTASAGVQSTTRIAELTGLTRKQIAQVRQIDNSTDSHSDKSVPAGLVLVHWHNTDKFLDDDGNPSVLPLSSKGNEPSFESLVQTVTSEVSALEMLSALLEANAVALDGNGAVRALLRSYIMSPAELATVRYFGMASSNLLSTLNHNIAENRIDAPYFERTAMSSSVSLASLNRFSQLVRESSRPFLELVDDWLAARAAGHEQTSTESATIGVGIYVFVREASDSPLGSGLGGELPGALPSGKTQA